MTVRLTQGRCADFVILAEFKQPVQVLSYIFGGEVRLFEVCDKEGVPLYDLSQRGSLSVPTG